MNIGRLDIPRWLQNSARAVKLRIRRALSPVILISNGGTLHHVVSIVVANVRSGVVLVYDLRGSNVSSWSHWLLIRAIVDF